MAHYLRLELGGGRLLADRPTDVVTAADLAGALDVLERTPTDLVLLDLALPDSAGLPTLLRVVEQNPGVPVVVVTGTEDDAFGEQALLAGADDYLMKGSYTGAELLRCLRHSLARHRRFLTLVDILADRDAGAGSLARLAALGAQAEGPTSRSLGPVSLSEAFPGAHTDAADRYGELIRLKVEEQGLALDYQVSSKARALAGDLGRLRANPRDVVDVHVAAVRHLTNGQPRARARALADSAAILLVEVIGHLAAYYRAQAIGRAGAGPLRADADWQVR